MTGGKNHFSFWKPGIFGMAVLLASLLFSALACNFQIQQDESLRQTDIALAIVQTRVGETATAMVLEASRMPANTPEPPTSEPPTAEPIVLTEAVSPTQPTDTSTPEKVASPTVVSTVTSLPAGDGSVVSITDWKKLNFVEPSSGCREQKDVPCYTNKMTGYTQWKKNVDASAYLTARNAVLIDPAWPNPYLVFSHDMDCKDFEGYLDLKIADKWLRVRVYKGTTGWGTEAIDLRPYKGKEILVMFSSVQTALKTSAGAKIFIDWSIQDVHIEPDYQP